MTRLDYIRTARIMRFWARTLRNSNSVKGNWPDAKDKAEHDEHLDLARKLEAAGRKVKA